MDSIAKKLEGSCKIISKQYGDVMPSSCHGERIYLQLLFLFCTYILYISECSLIYCKSVKVASLTITRSWIEEKQRGEVSDQQITCPGCRL